MGTGGLFVVASLAAAQLIQTPLPSLGPAAGVDVNVETVSWNSAGTALLYTKKLPGATGVGVYAAGQKEGRLLLSVADGDPYETQWFESAPYVIVIVYRQPKNPEERTRADIHLLDAKGLKDRLVYSRSFESKSGTEVDVDPSPGLIHAIFRIKDGNVKRHMVLTLSLSPLIAAPDLDQAVKEGFSGPSWSVEGTAVYSRDLPNNSSAGAEIDAATGLMRLRFAVIKDKRTPVVGDLPLLGRFFFSSPPTPPTGHPVLEVMPSNGALRQVRFRGTWESEEPELPPLGSVSQVASVVLGVSRGEAKSLWLTQGEESPERGVLIAPHAGDAWLSPRNRAVAYLVDGALFVREVRGR